MNECRICFEEENDGEFIKPCKCTGHVHRHCIKDWILAENNNSPTDCEVCLHQYSIDFEKMFADQLYRNNRIISETISISDTGEEEECEEHKDEIEINITPETIEAGTNQIIPQYSINISPYERVQIARRVLRQLTRRDREIKERMLAICLIGIVMDGFLVFSYFNVCHYERQCQMDIIAIGSAGTFFALVGSLYQSYLHYQYQNLRNNLGNVIR